ncbi:MAG: alpha-ketoglutarate-dependent dioxygenase AlkB [Chitinophagaceae bacterium]|jgi:alkylated DNA repair dioxygenase AlkB|nr:alpha-ketoglutarate-dependent dioxygenase AlkB [Chitinophagaceae bacterium]
MNWLPYDGKVHYYPSVFDRETAQHYFKELLAACLWKQDEVIMFGKKIITDRKSAWYGDEPFGYTYSKITRYALPWNKPLKEIKQILEYQTGEQFNSCLLNLYHSGKEGMGWHADDEPEMKRYGAIGSLSLGAARKFSFKHKTTKEKVDIQLENGSLLLMLHDTQEKWLHSLPKSLKVLEPRINLTFRTFV